MSAYLFHAQEHSMIMELLWHAQKKGKEIFIGHMIITPKITIIQFKRIIYGHYQMSKHFFGLILISTLTLRWMLSLLKAALNIVFTYCHAVLNSQMSKKHIFWDSVSIRHHNLIREELYWQRDIIIHKDINHTMTAILFYIQIDRLIYILV